MQYLSHSEWRGLVMARYDIILPIHSSEAMPVVRSIRIEDLRLVLRKGVQDFWAMPTHVIFLCVIYPIIGLLLFRVTFVYDLLPLLFPLAGGFALLGPFAAIGLYELSRRRELGLDTSWQHAVDIIHSPSLRPILLLGGLLLVVFGTWIAVANSIYVAYFDDKPLTSPIAFARQILTTPEGHKLFLVGNAVGFVFALVAASTSVIAFPLLLDRDVGVVAAVLTSLKVVAKNPYVMSVWFVFVAGALLLGSLPLLVGLAVVLPILGHATWHLYRVAVEPDNHPRPEYHPRPKRKRYAADFPTSLFTPSDDVVDPPPKD
jgi:uncharacterized membrane protein